MLIVRVPFRLGAFFTVALLFVISLAILNLCIQAGISHRSSAIRATRFYTRLILKIFHIHVHSQLVPPTKPVLYLCNHMSYLDVVVASTQLDAIFITSTEMRDTPGLGLLCRMANCLFVNRQHIWNLPQEVVTITQTLNDGYNVVLFPEGTTTSGHFLKPFKSSLIQSAINAGSDVVPLVLNFTKFNQRSPLLEDRDYYCWYGTMDFLRHLLRLCSIRSIEVHLKVLPTLTFKEGFCRKIITRKARTMINDRFEPIEVTH